jgi:uncharacterized membrane protein
MGVDHLRFHRVHDHLARPFGNDKFATAAETIARFFGTPLFVGAQTLIVLVWIAANVIGVVGFDQYPFILLNLAFSLQAAYAAPLILLAHARQAQRDVAHVAADAAHREAIAIAAAANADQLLELLQQNTRLTEATRVMSARIERLTSEVHAHLLRDGPA